MLPLEVLLDHHAAQVYVCMPPHCDHQHEEHHEHDTHHQEHEHHHHQETALTTPTSRP